MDAWIASYPPLLLLLSVPAIGLLLAWLDRLSIGSVYQIVWQGAFFCLMAATGVLTVVMLNSSPIQSLMLGGGLAISALAATWDPAYAHRTRTA